MDQMTLFSTQHFSYLEMGDCRQLDKFVGKLPSFTAAYISLSISSGEYCFVTCSIRMSIPIFPLALRCQKYMSGGGDDDDDGCLSLSLPLLSGVNERQSLETFAKSGCYLSLLCCHPKRTCNVHYSQ